MPTKEEMEADIAANLHEIVRLRDMPDSEFIGVLQQRLTEARVEANALARDNLALIKKLDENEQHRMETAIRHAAELAEKEEKLTKVRDAMCPKCSRSLAPDGDCYGCQADRLNAEMDLLASEAKNTIEGLKHEVEDLRTLNELRILRLGVGENGETELAFKDPSGAVEILASSVAEMFEGMNPPNYVVCELNAPPSRLREAHKYECVIRKRGHGKTEHEMRRLAEEELGRIKELMHIAAGENRVPVPEKGSIAEKLLLSNKGMRVAMNRAERNELKALAVLDEVRADVTELLSWEETQLSRLHDVSAWIRAVREWGKKVQARRLAD